MSQIRTLSIGLLILAATACSGGASGDGDADAGVDVDGADAGPSYADGDWLFEEDRILDVVIELPASSWDSVRLATRDILQILGEDCGVGPAPSVFSYVPAAVRIEGQSFDEVGIRKKGFLGSLSDTKPSLKLKMNAYVANQTMSGLSRFTLNNSVQDASYVNQCLGYNLFRKAGLPAPRCNFATVSVNGQSLGIYVHVEDVKKPFLRRHFGDDSGNLYEGTLSDFRAGWTATFEKKTNESIATRPEVDALESALLLDGDALRSALDDLIDIEAFMQFWALETLVAHGDGYSGNNNNFFVYADPATGSTVFIPWGMDQLFSDGAGGVSAARTRSILPRKLLLHDASRTQYIAVMTELLDSVWDDNEVLAEIAAMETLIRPSLSGDELAAFDADLAELRNTVAGREAEVRLQLAALSAADADALMEPLCFVNSGTITGSFATTWQGAGSADLTVVVDGQPLAFTQQSSAAVPDEDAPGMAVIAAFGDVADGRRSLLFLPLALEELAPSSIAVKNAAMLFYPPGSEDFDRIEFVSGTLTLSEAGTMADAPVIGSFDFDLWQSPF